MDVKDIRKYPAAQEVAKKKSGKNSSLLMFNLNYFVGG